MTKDNLLVCDPQKNGWIWLVDQNEQARKELGNVPKDKIVWQVDGNMYGRQLAAAAYRQKLENILLQKLGRTKFTRGQVDACVYHCSVTGIVLVHHIDDFDFCGPAESVKELLEVRLPKVGCKLKMGDFEGLKDDIGSQTTTHRKHVEETFQWKHEFVSEKDRKTYASCVVSAIYLSQDRAVLKFALKEIARHFHAPRLVA